MGKRSVERTFANWAVGAAGIALIALGLLIMLLREYPLQSMLLFGLAFGARHCWKEWRRKRRDADLARVIQASNEQIERHQSALIAYYRQSVRRDQFGNEDARIWHKWIAKFVDTQVRPRVPGSDGELLMSLREHVDRRVRTLATQDDGSLSEDTLTDLSPEQYERDCASTLFRRGWTVTPTPVTGDHGADVIAEKGAVRLVIQCKLYSQPVGNKAVQEVYSALRLYDGTHACVVAPKGFTAQAEQAAHGLSVSLLHHSQLESFADELLPGQRVSASVKLRRSL